VPICIFIPILLAFDRGKPYLPDVRTALLEVNGCTVNCGNLPWAIIREIRQLGIPDAEKFLQIPRICLLPGSGKLARVWFIPVRGVR
jgi:hypothetical protein